MIFTLFICAAIAGSYFFIDLPVAIASRSLDTQIVSVFQVITRLGNAAWYLVPAALLFLLFHYAWKREKWARWCLFVFSTVAISGLTADLFKWLAGRWRPKAYVQDQLYGFDFFGMGYEATSFPSGHATTIWAFCMAMTVLFPHYRLVWYALAILVSISRIIVGAHYLSDVLAGAYVAVITVLLLMLVPFFRLERKPA
ncbi:MAG: phosphatase PAP2 family protein [Syntrophales bacterium]|nr:phosphatase PAP2 family protein [Syntrophales bacterium]MCK9392592.1 phosphatase PAP2 family protein [Syntrophales bacterium]